MLKFVLLVFVLMSLSCADAEKATPAPSARAKPISVTTIPAGGSVVIDGTPRGTSPVTVPLEPGPHRIKALMSGYYPSAEQKIQVGDGAPTSHELTLVPSH